MQHQLHSAILDIKLTYWSSFHNMILVLRCPRMDFVAWARDVRLVATLPPLPALLVARSVRNNINLSSPIPPEK
jgi:hypothetical protein